MDNTFKIPPVPNSNEHVASRPPIATLIGVVILGIIILGVQLWQSNSPQITSSEEKKILERNEMAAKLANSNTSFSREELILTSSSTNESADNLIEKRQKIAEEMVGSK